jgi:Domain of Unknown Function (DUF1080)
VNLFSRRPAGAAASPTRDPTMTLPRLLAVAITAVIAASLPADDKPKTAAAADDDLKPMFNGKDLSGWVNVNCHPDTFFVKGDEIITTGKPTGYLRTEKQYENFIAEFDWMHVPPKPGAVGNSGFFVWCDPIPAVGTGYTRGIEVQVLVNLTYKNKKGEITATSQGDLFSIHGASCVPERPHPEGWARCLPSANHAKGENEWNHYRVEANDGVIKLAVNGHFVSSVSKCIPRKGYLALESEGSECHFKNMKIKELPSTNPKPEEVAKVAEGHASLFNGTDLTGWKTEKDSWKVKGEKLVSVGKADLASEKKYDRCELVFDWKVPAKEGKQRADLAVKIPERSVFFHTFEGDGSPGIGLGKGPGVKAGTWNRAVIVFDGKEARVDGKTTRLNDPLPAAPVTFQPAEGLEIMNVFVRELKEEKK